MFSLLFVQLQLPIYTFIQFKHNIYFTLNTFLDNRCLVLWSIGQFALFFHYILHKSAELINPLLKGEGGADLTAACQHSDCATYLVLDILLNYYKEGGCLQSNPVRSCHARNF